jgi:cytochrome c-type biogenesis protein
VLPLVPPYLCFLAGLSLDQLTGDEIAPNAQARIFSSALAFVAGFTTIFVILGASASTSGQLLADHQDVLSVIAGSIIIIFGLHFLGAFKIPLLYREAKIQVASKPTGLLGAYLVGLAFAFGWTPCVGPALTAILIVVASQDTIASDAFLLTAYALGIGIPFLIAALFAKPFLRAMRRFSRYLGVVEKIMGGCWC